MKPVEIALPDATSVPADSEGCKNNNNILDFASQRRAVDARGLRGSMGLGSCGGGGVRGS